MSYKQLFLLILTIWSAELFTAFLFDSMIDPLPTECQSECQTESSSEEQPKPGVLTLPRARLEQVADAVLKLAGG